MKLNSIGNVSFGANMVRQTRDIFGVGKVQATRAEWLDSYDSQIRTIQAQKVRSIELDVFMHSDKIKKMVNELPKNGILEVAGNFYQNSDSESEVKPAKLLLTYEQKNLSSLYDKEGNEIDLSMEAQNDDGSIDKEGIVNWLQKLSDSINQNKRQY